MKVLFYESYAIMYLYISNANRRKGTSNLSFQRQKERVKHDSTTSEPLHEIVDKADTGPQIHTPTLNKLDVRRGPQRKEGFTRPSVLPGKPDKRLCEKLIHPLEISITTAQSRMPSIVQKIYSAEMLHHFMELLKGMSTGDFQ